MKKDHFGYIFIIVIKKTKLQNANNLPGVSGRNMQFISHNVKNKYALIKSMNTDSLKCLFICK